MIFHKRILFEIDVIIISTLNVISYMSNTTDVFKMTWFYASVIAFFFGNIVYILNNYFKQ